MGTLNILMLEVLQRIRFHSISFPSKWGVYVEAVLAQWYKVSIQLVSPASGDGTPEEIGDRIIEEISIQLVSPASGDDSSQIL